MTKTFNLHTAFLHPGFDPTNLLLYVHISQVFSLWFVPFCKSHVYLVSLLHLRQNPRNNLYYICKQEDLYPVKEFVKFVWPFGDHFVDALRSMVTMLCVMSASVCVMATSAFSFGYAILCSRLAKLYSISA